MFTPSGQAGEREVPSRLLSIWYAPPHCGVINFCVKEFVYKNLLIILRGYYKMKDKGAPRQKIPFLKWYHHQITLKGTNEDV